MSRVARAREPARETTRCARVFDRVGTRVAWGSLVVARRRVSSVLVATLSLSLVITLHSLDAPPRATRRLDAHIARLTFSRNDALRTPKTGQSPINAAFLRGRRAEGGSVPAHEQLYRHEDVRDRRDGRGEDPSDERETAEHGDAAREGGPARRGDAPRERWGARGRTGTVSRRRDGARGDDARSRGTRGRARARRARRGNARERDGREGHGHTDVGDEWMERCGFHVTRRGARALFVRGGTRRTTE